MEGVLCCLYALMPPAPTLCLVLQGHRILEEGGVHVQPHSDNRNSKIALVQFESAAEAARALVSGGGRSDMHGVHLFCWLRFAWLQSGR